MVNIDFKALREDLRKLGLVLAGGGLAAIFLGSPATTHEEALQAMVLGLLFYVLGLFSFSSELENK